MKNIARFLVQHFLPGMYRERVFTKVYHKWIWGGQCESRSGPGSTVAASGRARAFLREIIEEYGIKTIGDAPCGDFHWLSKFTFPPDVTYTGYDIVKHLIIVNRQTYEKPSIKFKYTDIISKSIDKVDLVLCRDFLRHLPLDDIGIVLDNFRRSQSTYLLASTYPDVIENTELENKFIGSRPVNLQISPFSLGDPLRTCAEDDNGTAHIEGKKLLSLWKL